MHVQWEQSDEKMNLSSLLRIGPILTINKWFSIHTGEWERRWHLGMDKVLIHFFINIVVIYGFSSIGICMWNQLLSHNVIHFKLLFLNIDMLFTSQISLVSLCCWCILLHETLIQTQQTFLILMKGRIWDSMNLVSTEVPFCSWIQKSNIQL